MNKIDILPDVDLQNSREYYGLYNSRDFYKGTSFKMSGEWIEGTHYFNDEYIVDFISFEGALLSCTRSHVSTAATKPRLKKAEDGTIIGIEPSNHWNFVMAGSEGPEGKSWVPTVEDGKLKWVLTSGEPSEVPITDLKGDPGEKGETGDTGKTGRAATIKLGTVTTGDPGSSVVIKNRGTETDAILDFVIPKGDTGSPGPSGRDGVDGRTGDKGDPGKNATIKIGTIKTGEAGSKVSITNSGTDTNVILNITIPKGDKGDKGSTGDYGPQGIPGVPGKDGETPEFKIVTTSSGIEKELYYKTPSESEWHNAGIVSNIPGKSVKLIRVWGRPGSLEDDRILWGYDGIPVSEWTTLCYLNELKGDTIENVDITDDGKITMEMSSGNLLTTEGDVLPRFVEGVTETIDWDQKANITLNKSNAPREWALNVKVPKGKPATVTVVSEVEKLAPDAQPYVTDLNPDISDANLKFGIPQGEKGDPGDENIAIGCQSDFPNNEPEHDKIWYDPCDESMDEYSVQDFLYNSYIAVGGTLNQEQFEAAWKSFPNTAGIVEIIDSLESDKTDAALSAAQGKALKTLIDDLKASVAAALDYKGTKDSYDQLPSSGNKKGDVWNVVAAHGTTPAGTNYAWDGAKWDPLGGTIDLSGYYTKSQVDDAISAAKTELEAADTALEGQITTVTNQLNNKVDKVEGSGLISDTDLNQIRTNKSDIESLQTSVGGKQDELTPGNAVSITEENVIDVKLDPASNEALSKSAEGLKLDLSGIKGSTVKVGVSITGGAEIGADQTIAAGMQALSDSIKTAVAGGITSITSPDNTIKVTGEGTSRGLAVDMSKLVSTSSSIQVGIDSKLDIFWL